MVSTILEKTVFVEYPWNPVVCNHCKVFAHSLISCQKRPRTEKEIKLKNKVKADAVNNEGFVKVNRRRNNANGEGGSKKAAEIRYKLEMEKGTKEDNSQSDIEENVFEDYSDIANFLAKNEMQNKSMNVLFEGASGELNVSKIYDKIFGRWEWAPNAKYSPSGCRIIIGWDQSYVKIMVIHNSNQSIFCLIEDVSTTFRMLCTIIYAKNDGKEKKDFNVTSRIDEDSEGMSCSSADMIEFQECIERIEMEDLNKIGCHFTWTKSLKNLNTVIMNKLDRIMGNGDFISNFPQVQASFLPFLVSDHSPAVMIIPKSLKKKNRAFRFSNYISDKEEFIPIVKKGWDMRIEGFKIVAALKEELKVIQIKSIENVHDADLRKEAADKLSEYNEAVNDEVKFLYQLAKHGIRHSGDAVPKQFVTHFKNFHGVSRETECITNAQELFTQKVVSNEEVDLSKFFEAAWEMLGSDVFEAIKEFFQSGKLLGELNVTIISLVPKIKTLAKVLEGFGFPMQFIRWVMTCVSTAAFLICVNGEIHGYFKGGRGLRQGDPISSYLFTIVMEVLNLIIQRKITQLGNFRYHTGCEDLKITNLCFADDLLILCNGDCDSVKVIKLALEEFSSVSGLVPNLSKSTMFCSNINEDLKKEILEIVLFVVGKLRVRYLGVPLVTRRLRVKDCKSLVEKLCRHTGLLFFSFLRLLLKKLIASLKVSYGAKVKRLKGRNVWEVPSDDNASWGWRKLMELREQVRPHIRHCLGNGESTNMWHDYWCDIGPNDEIVTRRQIFSAGFQNNATVASMFGDGQSKIPDDWISQNSLLKQVKPTLNKNSVDKVRWQSNDKNMVKFSIHRVWKDLRDQYDRGACLCCEEIDSHGHLFFKCKYDAKIWEEVRRKCQMQSGSNDWKDLPYCEEDMKVSNEGVCSHTSDA
ncbi:RNA-directed DNA polymerase, eukaryota, reverse transcriptase zinc-binding domain protein [Tanacetum coccineum]